MPITIQGTTNVKMGFAPGAEDARKLLFDVTKNLQGKSGSLKLMHTTDAERDMSFERKSWYQFGTRGENKLANTATFVSNLFQAAYQGGIDKMPPGEAKDAKQQALKELIRDFTATVESKGFTFGKNTMRKFFNRAEEAFTNVDHRLSIDPESDMNKDVMFQPRPEVAQQPLENKPLQDGQKKEATFGQLKNPKDLLMSFGGSVKVLQENVIQEPVLKILPPFHSVQDASLTQCINKGTGANLQTAKTLGEGSNGVVYKAINNEGEDVCIKVAKNRMSSALKVDPSLRNFDATAIYLNSKGGVPGVSTPTSLFVLAQKGQGQPVYHHVPLGNPQAAKKYLRELTQKNEVVNVVGMEMPFAVGADPAALRDKGQLTAGDRKEISKQLLGTMSKLHDRGLVDRDYKPENLLYDRNEKTLTKIDSSFMTKLSSNPQKNVRDTLFLGTPAYFCQRKLDQGGYGPEVDMYEGAMSLMDLKYGEAFTDAAFSRFTNVHTRNLREPQAFTSFQAKNPNQSYLRNLLGYAATQGADVKQILSDLDKNDPETKYYEKMFEVAMKSQRAPGAGKGRSEVYADYYQQMNQLKQDPWVN